MGSKFVLFIIIIFLYSYANNELIKLNANLKSLKNITTKLGVIEIEYGPPPHYDNSIEYYLYAKENLPLDLPDNSSYKFKNVLNANSYRTSLSSYSIENNTITVKVNSHLITKYFICELLYRTKYIDKFIYSLDNNNFVYFGGTPEYLIKNHNNYTFGDKPYRSIYFNSIVSNISIEINDKYKFKVDLYNKLLFSYDMKCPGIICIKSQDFKKFKEQYDNFLIENNILSKKATISFKISDKIVNFTTNESPYEYLVEGNIFSLGKKFLTLFDYREYNLENGFVNFYMDKNKSNFVHIYNEKMVDTKTIKYNSCFYDYFIYFIFLFLTIFTFIKTYDRNKNLYINTNLISSNV